MRRSRAASTSRTISTNRRRRRPAAARAAMRSRCAGRAAARRASARRARARRSRRGAPGEARRSRRHARARAASRCRRCGRRRPAGCRSPRACERLVGRVARAQATRPEAVQVGGRSFPCRERVVRREHELQLLREQLLDDQRPGSSGASRTRGRSRRGRGARSARRRRSCGSSGAARRVVDREPPHERARNEAAEALEDPDPDDARVALAERPHLARATRRRARIRVPARA